LPRIRARRDRARCTARVRISALRPSELAETSFGAMNVHHARRVIRLHASMDGMSFAALNIST
jgi:hypothetical protein